MVKELRLANITNIDDANRYIREEYISKYNNRFGVEATKEGNVHIGLSCEQKSNLDRIFTKEELRSL